MINKIIDGITASLNQEFGDDYEIYTEDIEQGLEEPCFSIVCINPNKNKFLGDRYFSKNKFCIYYFPKSREKNNEINDITDRLFDCLEYITVDGGLVRGIDFKVETSDGVLCFFVNYNFFVYKDKEKIFMENLKLINKG